MTYPFPWAEFGQLAADIFLGRKRSVVADAAAMWRRVEREPVISGLSSIPSVGSFVVAVNHYQRRGLWIAWPAGLVNLAVAAARNGDAVRWMVTGELQLAQWSNRGPILPGSLALFRRVASTYGLIELPVSDRVGRAAATRRVLNCLNHDEIVGIFPEGLRGGSGKLGPAVGGFDQLAMRLAKRRVPVLPAAVYELDQRLCLQIGVPTIYNSAAGVMEAIAALMPHGADARNHPSQSAVSVGHREPMGGPLGGPGGYGTLG